MAFIVEDGTGLSTATSFASVAYADAYFVDRLNETWAAYTTAQKQSYLMQSTTHINISYEFNGELLLTTQSLNFPRVVDGETIYPDKLLQATCEGAVRVAIAPLSKDIGEKVTERTVGPLTTKYAEFSSPQPTYSIIDGLLKDYTFGSGSCRKVIRS